MLQWIILNDDGENLMYKQNKKQIEEMFQILLWANDEIKKAIEKRQFESALDILEQCQDAAIQLGTSIEKSEGEGFVTVSYIEEFCEEIYQIHEAIMENGSADAISTHKKISKSLSKIEQSIKNDIPVKKIAVFLPYKASMWDSLESVWKAADADPDCEAFVIPIPYFDKNKQDTPIMHYEADLFPEYVPITAYDKYDFEVNRPDVIYIHNPYDDWNMVTTVHPFFYSSNLKKYTDLLIYIPYYATSGATGEGQALCPAYVHADFIVIQSESQLKYFDSRIPREKFLPLGSPKFDRVISMCENPPEVRKSWKNKMAGKKVYFYNTSLSGMLTDTDRFLKKMEYVFDCFQNKEQACLLWRPHPLMESTFDTMRKEYKQEYLRLKERFLSEEIGIYDDTPDIEMTIANCDAYVGDTGTSVTSLFGVAGKPMFLLNNNIHTIPTKEDTEKELIREFFPNGCDEWQVTMQNQLYHSCRGSYHYQYVCDLSPYGSGWYYLRAIEVEEKLYICPANGQDVLILDKNNPANLIKKIILRDTTERGGAFCNAWSTGKYIFLIPMRYAYIVRIDTETEEVVYIDGYKDLIAAKVQGEWIAGGSCIWEDYLVIASPTSQKMVRIHTETLQSDLIIIDEKEENGWFAMTAYEDCIYLVPYNGTTVSCYNMKKGEIVAYCVEEEGLLCYNRIQNTECMERPFAAPIIFDNRMFLLPNWSNMFVEVDLQDGVSKKWNAPFLIKQDDKDGYLRSYSLYINLGMHNVSGNITYRIYDVIDRCLYHYWPKSNQCEKMEVTMDRQDVLDHAVGFGKLSQWQMYGCEENAVQTLNGFIDEQLPGAVFDAVMQKKTYEEVAANNDGSCGEKIHAFSMLMTR